jgi:hypothetical protein
LVASKTYSSTAIAGLLSYANQRAINYWKKLMADKADSRLLTACLTEKLCGMANHNRSCMPSFPCSSTYIPAHPPASDRGSTLLSSPVARVVNGVFLPGHLVTSVADEHAERNGWPQ